MDDPAWYSRRLVVATAADRDRLIVRFVAPLIRLLDGSGFAFRFHVFRYSGPPPYLRLRIRGEETTLRIVEEFEQANLDELSATAEDDPYRAEDEIRPPIGNEEDVEKLWCLYEVGSRMAIECAKNGLAPVLLRSDDFALGIRLNHLCLNSIGYSVEEEYMLNRIALVDRAIVLLMLHHKLPEAEVHARFSDVLLRISAKLDEATQILNNALA